MTPNVTTLVVALKTITLALGGFITLQAFRAYQRTESLALRALALGFGAVTVGAIAAGVADQLLPVDPNLALVVESLFTTVGFAIILYSLYVEK